MGIGRRSLLLAAASLLLAGRGRAAETSPLYLRLGAGPPGQSHFPLGGIIAGALSLPPGGRCPRNGACGVPGLIVAAVATKGSVANIRALAEHQIDLALIQSDIAWWAFEGKGPFQSRPLPGLRVAARFTPDLMHLVARRELGLTSPSGLRQRTVAIGEAGSGTRLHAEAVLGAWGLSRRDLTLVEMRSGVAADALVAGEIDAFFVMDAAPSPAVAELAHRSPIALIPIRGKRAEAMRAKNPFLEATSLPGGTYRSCPEATPTLSVGLSLALTTELSADMVHAMCKALWTTHPGLASPPDPQLGPPAHPGAVHFLNEVAGLR